VNPDRSDLPFDKYRSNIYSEAGEDGVVAELLCRLGTHCSGTWCVEFGAWDGTHTSNTFALVERGWHAVYIEGDESRYQDLLKTATKHPRITPVNAFVARTSTDDNSLDAILQRTAVPTHFSVLSIDIDSYDCDVWESLRLYRPDIVIIEINSSVPPGVVWRHSAKTPLNTFTATMNVALKKGYTLVCHTGNLLFVRNDLIGYLNLEQRYVDYPELLFMFDNPWLSSNLFGTRRAIDVRRFIPRPLRPFFRRLYRVLSGRAHLTR
jgi:hypothetical protein